ncbi:protein Rf1, mitochondrial [Triticum aestivum]|uniref:Restorer of fertility-like protein n=1 Tax=Triticum aestivum TaxID=4565 RepID=A0A7S5V979_WHEAT|nr:protein Rf1, mitochondrial-like [Triticum aestivum]QIP66320.1 restorer of fertility-like protein [Triticum aestivum]
MKFSAVPSLVECLTSAGHPVSSGLSSPTRSHIRHCRKEQDLPRLTRSSSSSGSSRVNQLLNKLKDYLGSGTLRPELAHQLFVELFRQTVPVSADALNVLFSALACGLPSAACNDGPALAIALFKHMARARCRQVMAPTNHTYNTLIECCHMARRPDIGLVFFGLLLKIGITADVFTFNSLLKCLCDMKQTDEALGVLLHRMPGDMPDVISYSVIIKSFCDNGRSHRALDLLRMMTKKGYDHSPNVVSYTIIIDGLIKEGELSKACALFHEMMQQGVVPDVVTYSSIIDGLCKARALDEAEVVLRQMIDSGV